MLISLTSLCVLPIDPHIKITGLPENIKKAKDMVAVKLESKVSYGFFFGRNKLNVLFLASLKCHLAEQKTMFSSFRQITTLLPTFWVIFCPYI